MGWVRRGFVAGVAVIGTLAGSVVPVQAADTYVRTDSGLVRGAELAGYRSFQGIPFAAPPVGELRWRSPRPPKPWAGVRETTAPGSACVQGTGEGSEDCLYLNVTVPDGGARLKPVMVWVHGGAHSFGTGATYDPRRMAVAGDVVVVTTNFRLGVFGFFGHAGLADSGAFGLEDQVAALRWVRRNAIAFGGDPSRVTLFGESSGAFDVCAQLTSPLAQGLFQRAIIQSGTCSTTWPDNGLGQGLAGGGPWLSLQEVEEQGAALAAEHGCSDVDCLRRVPAVELSAVIGVTPAAFGNRVLPENPARALASGRFHRVPVIAGHTRDEGRSTAAFAFPEFTEERYREVLADAFDARAPQVAAKYPSGTHGSPGLAWGAVLSDRVWACSHLVDDRYLARRTPIYGYEFADRNAPTGGIEFPADIPGGAFHSSELAYLFDLTGFEVTFTPEQQRLAAQMIAYWTRFAATGDPNGRNLPAWQPFRHREVQSLAPDAIRPVDLEHEHNCKFWVSQ